MNKTTVTNTTSTTAARINSTLNLVRNTNATKFAAPVPYATGYAGNMTAASTTMTGIGTNASTTLQNVSRTYEDRRLGFRMQPHRMDSQKIESSRSIR